MASRRPGLLPEVRLVRAVVGLLGGVVVLAAVTWALGPGELLRTVRTARRPLVVAAVGLGLGVGVVWGTSLWVVLRRLGADVRVGNAVGLFFLSGLANAFTPFGQAGGDAVSGYLVGRETRLPYERALAGVTSVNTVNRLVSICLGVAAAAFLLVRHVAATVRVEWALTLLVGVLAGGVVAVALVSRHLDVLRALVVRAGTAVGAVVGRLPWASTPSRADVTRRVDRFGDALVRLGDRRTVAAVLGFGTLGELGVVAVLWTALAAVDVAASPVVLLVVVPVARLGAVVPTPGGLGGVEVALVGLLVAVAGVHSTDAAAAVLFYRTAAHGVPLVVGGVVGAVLAADG